MNRLLACSAALLLALGTSAARAGELSASLGIFTLSRGLDVQLGYRADGSPWELGYRFVRWTETFEFRGTELTDTTTTRTGPLVNYLFSPGARRSWYVGAALYKWSQEEESLRTGTTVKDSRVAPFFGGGYRGASTWACILVQPSSPRAPPTAWRRRPARTSRCSSASRSKGTDP